MTDKPDGKRWGRGLIWATLLAIGCVSASAWTIEWTDYPRPIRARWPHMDMLPMILVLGPASIFWWFYFTYHWRGRALLIECQLIVRRTIRQPIFWLLVVVIALCCLSLVSPSVRSAA
jgi:hypothetical protein